MKKLFTLTVIASLAGLHVFSTPYNPPTVQLMKSNLYVLGTGGDTTLLDGDLTQYDQSFSNSVDGLDARKMSNFSENIGMIRQATTLVVERRHTIEANDTTFYRIWNTSAARKYQLQFISYGMAQPGLEGYVEDLYLNTKTPLNLEGTTFVNFNIDASPASSNTYRFRVIYTTVASGVLPLTFISQNAYQQQNAIKIDWKTAAESNMKEYVIEKSQDGKAFAFLTRQKAGNLTANNYSYTDASPAEGNNYYRVMSTSTDGISKYGSIMKVSVENAASVINVFPNPVTGNAISLRLLNQPAGIYKIRLLSSFGQNVLSKEISHTGGSATQSIAITPGMPHGIYQLEIVKPGGGKNIISLIY